MTDEKRWPTRDEQEQMWEAAQFSARVGGRVPKCSVCGQGMRKDDFNGMWCCSYDYISNREVNHGGYQTTDQVARLFYLEDAEEDGFYA